MLERWSLAINCKFVWRLLIVIAPSSSRIAVDCAARRWKYRQKKQKQQKGASSRAIVGAGVENVCRGCCDCSSCCWCRSNTEMAVSRDHENERFLWDDLPYDDELDRMVFAWAPLHPFFSLGLPSFQFDGVPGISSRYLRFS